MSFHCVGLSVRASERYHLARVISTKVIPLVSLSIRPRYGVDILFSLALTLITIPSEARMCIQVRYALCPFCVVFYFVLFATQPSTVTRYGFFLCVVCVGK